MNDPEVPELDDTFFKDAILTRPGESLIDTVNAQRASPIPVGTRVRMTKAFRKMYRWLCRPHVREFGRCIGIVQGLTDYNNCKPGEPGYDAKKVGPEVDVRWEPSNLRYAYDPRDLERVP